MGLVLIILILLLLLLLRSQIFQLSSLAPIAVTESNVPINPALLTFIPRTLLVIKIITTSSVLIFVTTPEVRLVVSAVPPPMVGGPLMAIVAAASHHTLRHRPSIRGVLVHTGHLGGSLSHKFPSSLSVICTFW